MHAYTHNPHTNIRSRADRNAPTAVLFVCLGNICRSVAAQHVFEAVCEARGVADRFFADSAGTYGGHEGQQADPRMRHAAAQRGYNLTHRARQVRAADFSRFDVVLAMDDSNRHNLLRLAPTLHDQQKVRRMADYLTAFPTYDYVPDPYYEGAEGFELVLDMLEDGCARLCDQLLQEREENHK
ncbi:MAG: low molecular weight phosphotyrosine protein phosphatase [Bacteroidaceae bacterium]|nr:low molecular weight phosphotyrosine protein phosphatase [Bacteroidaceae bacterium]